MFEVGVWNANLPLSQAKKRAANGSPAESTIPLPHLRAGAKAFIKPNVNWDFFGVTFLVCDARGAAANAKYNLMLERLLYLQLKPGLSLAQARADEAITYDCYELERVQTYNIGLVVAWAKARLVRHLRSKEQENPIALGTPNPAGDRPIGQDSVVENHIEFVEFISCQSKIEEAEILARDCRAITEARPHHHTLL
ncbi:hypothetical protein QBC43DRAFT_287821 [Cladorrhinum sp. PSN259]|nr:hypothetical protein QBC43DRAFT_287821 [Cladorrhinum sp. PSN259]